MTSSVKIFRPWASVKEDELVKSRSKINEKTGSTNNMSNLSVYTRVPEPGYPIAEFAADTGSWYGLPFGFEDCWLNSGVQTLPFHSADSLAHNLSYLDSAYLEAVYGNAKVAKLKQRPKKFR